MSNLVVYFPYLAAGLATLAILFFVVLAVNLVTASKRSQKQAVDKRLKAMVRENPEHDAIKLLREEYMSDSKFMDAILSKLRLAGNLQRIIKQANLKLHVSVLLMGCLLFALVGFTLAQSGGRSPLMAVGAALTGFYIPIFFVKAARKRRMNKFQRQLPDALDLIARALRAGHAFPSGMKMVGEEFVDPIGPEFAQTLEEINFGMDPDTALQNLDKRVDCPDLKFFIVSVSIQRETGGNLSDIVANIAHLVRERFKLQGRVEVLAAEGKLTAYILIGLPFVVAIGMYLLNPVFMSKLIDTELGNTMIKGALFQMTLGVLTIRKLIQIKV